MQIVTKDIENGKKIKDMHMNTLHDRFPDLDLGEDAREIKLNLLRYKFKMVLCYYIQNQPP